MGIPTYRLAILKKVKISQALHTTRIKYLKASGSGNPPSLIPALRKTVIYVLKMKFSILFCTRLWQWKTCTCVNIKHGPITKYRTFFVCVRMNC